MTSPEVSGISISHFRDQTEAEMERIVLSLRPSFSLFLLLCVCFEWFVWPVLNRVIGFGPGPRTALLLQPGKDAGDFFVECDSASDPKTDIQTCFAFTED